MNKKIIVRIIWLLFMLLFAIIILTPILYAVSASFRTNKEIMLGAFSLIPKSFNFDNYKNVWILSNFAQHTWNSVYFSLFTVFGTLVTVSMAAYAFSRYDFPGKKVIFTTLTSTMFVSMGSATLFQTMRIANILHINNSLFGVVIIHIFGAHISYIFLTRNFLSSVPKEVEEAAKIDGANFYQIFFKIMLPMMIPILGAVGILCFKTSWNEYLLPMLFTLTTPHKATLAVALQSLKSSGGAAANWDLQVAGVVITMLPIITIYIIFNKYFTGGLASGAVKG